MNKFKGARITFIGEPMSMYYPYATAWEVRKYKFFMWIRRTVIKGMVLAGVAGIIFTTYKIGQNNPDISLGKELVAVVAPPVHAGITKEAQAYKSIEQIKKEMVDAICNKERAGIIQKVGTLFMTFDPSKEDYQSCIRIGGNMSQKCMSYGECQIKVPMLQQYYPKLYGKSISEVDALALTQDPVKARQFTQDCTVKIEGCALRWTTVRNNLEYFNIVLPIIRKTIDA